MINIFEYLFTFLLGLLSAFWVNYLSDTLPLHGKITAPKCKFCKTNRAWSGYIFFSKCHFCGKKRSPRDYIVLITYPALFCLFLIIPLHRLNIWSLMILSVYFGLVAIIDIEHRLVLQPIIIIGIILCGLIGFDLHGLWPTIVGAFAGFVIMFFLYLMGVLYIKWISKVRNLNKDEIAFGFGDVRLSMVLGLILGWPGVTLGLLFGVLIGGIFGLGVIIMMLVRRSYQPLATIPYTPFLLLGTAILLLR